MAPDHSRKLIWLGRALCVIVVLLAVGLTAITWSIRSGVARSSDVALREHPGDRVLALIAYVEAETHPLRERNRAVWTLGRLRDPRALATLERRYVGEPCDHGSLLCQRELRKAIDRTRGKASPNR